MEGLYSLSPKAFWAQFRREGFAFWMICGYLFIEYVRPQSIFPAINFLPWASLFLLLSLIGLFFEKGSKWTAAPSNKWMLAFLVLILLSSWNAVFPEASFEKLDTFYTWFIIYFLIICIVNTRERFLIFLSVFVIATFKISLSLAIKWARRGFSFTTWGLQGPPGFFTNSGELAIQMCVFFPIAYVLAFGLKTYVSRNVYWILMLMPITAAMTVMGASSRGGQIALAAQILVMFWRKLYRPKVFIGLAIIGVVLYSILPDEQKARFSSSGDDRTSQQRLLYWEHGLDMIKERPLTGVGFFNFAPYYQRYFTDDMLYASAELPHNIFIQVGTDAGVPALLVFLMLIFQTIKINRSTIRICRTNPSDSLFGQIAWSLNVALLGFVVAGQFVTVTYYPYMWINLALTVSLNCSIRRQMANKNYMIPKAKRG